MGQRHKDCVKLSLVINHLVKLNGNSLSVKGYVGKDDVVLTPVDCCYQPAVTDAQRWR